MTQERGGYCSIRRVLLDGPDFQKLSERARWVFVALKLNVGPTGIDVFYPSALIFQLAAQTGAQPSDVTDALAELEEAGWVVREGNVVWLVGHLKNDPHMKPKDDKHRKSVVKHLSGLPRLEIVRAFVAAHPEFFPSTDARTEALAWAIEGPSKGHRSRERERERETERETKKKERGADAPAPRASWVARIHDFWRAEVGRLDPGRLGRDAKPYVDRHGPEKVERAVRAYVAATKGKRAISWAFFIGEIEVWIDRIGKIGVVDGEMTPELERLTRPGAA